MAVTLENVKQHLRIEDFDNSENDYLLGIIAAATTYISGVTEIENDESTNPQYEIAAYLLISHWYSNRQILSDGGKGTIPYGFSMLMQNLRPAESLF